MKTKIDTVECIVCGQTVPTTKAEGALLTNLVKKELIHIWNYDTDRREHTIQLSDFGFRLYQYLKGGTNETYRHAN